MKNLLLLWVVVLFAIPTIVSAQTEAENYKIDSTLYDYLQKCKANVRKPIVLSMSDTLFSMAGKLGDQRMQAVALCTKLDHYYYLRKADSIPYFVNVVKEFARKTNQPKYYYFAWGKRLILFYLTQGNFTLALYESEKMLKEAQAENNKEGIMTCYNALSSIYIAKGQDELSLKYNLEEVDFIEKHNLENYNISILYHSIASFYINKKELEEALKWIKKTEKSSTSIKQKIYYQLLLIRYNIATKNIKEAEKGIEQVHKMIEQNKNFAINNGFYLLTQRMYYIATKQYDKAVSILLSSMTPGENTTTEVLDYARYRLVGEIYYSSIKNEKLAAYYFRKYVIISDSLSRVNEKKAAGEFATLMNIEKLNSENSELKFIASQETLKSRTIVIILLAITLSIFGLFLYKVSYLNLKLKRSEQDLKSKNEALEISQDKLQKENEKVEVVGRIKSIFIQNMSHEIRTPLNAIVGFSGMIAHLAKSEDLEEYSNIIEANSNTLLKLVNDVIDISNLDSSTSELAIAEMDIDSCCRTIIESTSLVNENVAVIYKPQDNSPTTILANEWGLSQILGNLYHNASKFTKEGSIILAYEIVNKGKTIKISVTDTGIGIPKDQHEKIFNRFVKLDSFSQGAGLGLTICQSIAEKMGGTIYIDDSYSNGSRFVVELPINA